MKVLWIPQTFYNVIIIALSSRPLLHWNPLIHHRLTEHISWPQLRNRGSPFWLQFIASQFDKVFLIEIFSKTWRLSLSYLSFFLGLFLPPKLP